MFSTHFHVWRILDCTCFSFMCSAMEEFMTRFPQYADFKRMEDENTALHIAASNDKLEVLKYLCSLVRILFLFHYHMYTCRD